MDSDDTYERWKDPTKCFVPFCGNNNVKNSNLVFFTIRKELKERWCKMLNRNCPKRRLYCCQNHINLEEDIENYNEWLNGARPKLRLDADLINIPKGSKVEMLENKHRNTARRWVGRYIKYGHVRDSSHGGRPSRESKDAIERQKVERDGASNKNSCEEGPSKSMIEVEAQSGVHANKETSDLKMRFSTSDTCRSVLHSLVAEGIPKKASESGTASNAKTAKKNLTSAAKRKKTKYFEKNVRPQTSTSKTKPTKETVKKTKKSRKSSPIICKPKATEAVQRDYSIEVGVGGGSSPPASSPDDNSGSGSDDDVPDTPIPQCSTCKKSIKGFRYTCVQCVDYDLCQACEVQKEHSSHYVLRIPPHRPPEEAVSALRSVRAALHLALASLEALIYTRDQTQIKEETTDPLEAVNNMGFGPNAIDQTMLDLGVVPKEEGDESVAGSSQAIPSYIQAIPGSQTATRGYLQVTSIPEAIMSPNSNSTQNTFQSIHNPYLVVQNDNPRNIQANPRLIAQADSQSTSTASNSSIATIQDASEFQSTLDSQAKPACEFQATLNSQANSACEFQATSNTQANSACEFQATSNSQANSACEFQATSNSQANSACYFQPVMVGPNVTGLDLQATNMRSLEGQVQAANNQVNVEIQPTGSQSHKVYLPKKKKFYEELS